MLCLLGGGNSMGNAVIAVFKLSVITTLMTVVLVLVNLHVKSVRLWLEQPTSVTKVRLTNNQQKINVTTTTQSISAEENLYYRRQSNKVNEYKHHLILGPSRQPVCINDTLMIVLVHSHPSYVAKRQAIRKTWGKTIQSDGNDTWPFKPDCCRHFRLFFVLGLAPQYQSAIRAEQETHNDIIQGDFIDAYRNMTLKSLFGLKVVSEECPNVQYLLKSDDDMFINLPFMLQRLKLKPLRRSMMGPCEINAEVKREGKWALTREEFKFNYFPPYLPGSAYVISRDVVTDLFETSEYVPPIFIDDVYVTGILGRILNITLVCGSGGPRMFAHAYMKAASVCEIANNEVMTSTRMTPPKLISLWRALRRLDGKKQKRRCR